MEYATTLRAAGKTGPATDILKKILEEGLHGVPFNQPEVFANLLAMAQDSGTTPALAEYLDSVRTRQIPGKAEFYVSSAKLLMQIGEPEKAREFLQQFVDTEPDSRLLPDGLLLLGQIEYMNAELDKARETFTRVRDEHSTTPAAITASFNVAEIQRQQGDVKLAIETWVKLAAAFPTSDKALSAIHVAALSAWNDLKDQQLAIELMDSFIHSGSQDFEMLRHARQSLENMKAGKPPVKDESADK
jgi:tetratricopeptide (TPR) repeat protein